MRPNAEKPTTINQHPSRFCVNPPDNRSRRKYRLRVAQRWRVLPALLYVRQTFVFRARKSQEDAWSVYSVSASSPAIFSSLYTAKSDVRASFLLRLRVILLGLAANSSTVTSRGAAQGAAWKKQASEAPSLVSTGEGAVGTQKDRKRRRGGGEGGVQRRCKMATAPVWPCLWRAVAL